MVSVIKHLLNSWSVQENGHLCLGWVKRFGTSCFAVFVKKYLCQVAQLTSETAVMRLYSVGGGGGGVLACLCVCRWLFCLSGWVRTSAKRVCVWVSECVCVCVCVCEKTFLSGVGQRPQTSVLLVPVCAGRKDSSQWGGSETSDKRVCVSCRKDPSQWGGSETSDKRVCVCEWVCVCVCVCVCVYKTLLSQWPGWVRDLRQTAVLFFWPSISGGGAWPASFREYYFGPVVMSFDRLTCAYATFGLVQACSACITVCVCVCV